MIVSTVSLKGGVGKTTTAINLSVAFAHQKLKVTLIDSDANGNSIYWSGVRPDDSPFITTVALNNPDALRKNVKALYNDCDVLVIDGTPALSELTSSIILLSSIVIIPILPSPLDIWATQHFLEKFQQAHSLNPDIKGFFLLNKFDARRRLSEDAEQVVKDIELIQLLETKLHDRVAYAETIAEGLGVYEGKDTKAKDEIIRLTKEIEKLVK